MYTYVYVFTVAGSGSRWPSKAGQAAKTAAAEAKLAAAEAKLAAAQTKATDAEAKLAAPQARASAAEAAVTDMREKRPPPSASQLLEAIADMGHDQAAIAIARLKKEHRL